MSAAAQFDTNMKESLMTRCDRWHEWLTKKFPKREYKTAVVDINGKLVFITSYFKKLAPPPQLLEGSDVEKAVGAAAETVLLLRPPVLSCTELMKSEFGFHQAVFVNFGYAHVHVRLIMVFCRSALLATSR